MLPQIPERLKVLPAGVPGLYIHIPFCRTKCPYCDFYSVTGMSKIPDFLISLESEMEMAGREWTCFDTVYIGGGTPSILSPEQIERVLCGVRKNFSLVSGAEITLEANPADLSPSFLQSLKAIGIHRLNLGVQSFDPKALEFLGRRHSVGQALSAVESARQAGFADLGLDLIYGIPGQSMHSWMSTLSRAASFSPEHISCYQLTLERGTPLGKALEEGIFSLLPEGEQLGFFMATSEALEKGGFIHYEVSNFARGTRFASRHNQKYWEHTPYLGLGPGAHSFCGRKRWWNEKSVDRYIAAMEAGAPPPGNAENLTPEDLRMEAFFLGVRTRKGIDVEGFSREHGYDLIGEKGMILKSLEAEGLVLFEEGRLRPTRKGLALADSLALV